MEGPEKQKNIEEIVNDLLHRIGLLKSNLEKKLQIPGVEEVYIIDIRDEINNLDIKINELNKISGSGSEEEEKRKILQEIENSIASVENDPRYGYPIKK